MTPITDRAVVSSAFIEREMDYYSHKFVLAAHMEKLEAIAEELAAELEEIVDWMKVERAPLRPQEISSIQLKLARYQQLKEKAK